MPLPTRPLMRAMMIAKRVDEEISGDFDVGVLPVEPEHQGGLGDGEGDDQEVLGANADGDDEGGDHDFHGDAGKFDHFAIDRKLDGGNPCGVNGKYDRADADDQRCGDDGDAADVFGSREEEKDAGYYGKQDKDNGERHHACLNAGAVTPLRRAATLLEVSK
jgi:hypothetical protein